VICFGQLQAILAGGFVFDFSARGASEQESKAKYGHLSARSGGELKVKTE